MSTVIAVRAQTSDATRPASASPAPAGPTQPIPYSHKRHLALGLECRQCHVNPDAGEMMTFPATAICMSCHQAGVVYPSTSIFHSIRVIPLPVKPTLSG